MTEQPGPTQPWGAMMDREGSRSARDDTVMGEPCPACGALPSDQVEDPWSAHAQRSMVPHEDQTDAKRYRWLRDHGHIILFGRADVVDQAVDREMAKPPAEFPF